MKSCQYHKPTVYFTDSNLAWSQLSVYYYSVPTFNQGRRNVWKSGEDGGASSSNMVGIICPPLINIRLTDFQNLGPPALPDSDDPVNDFLFQL